MAEMLDFDVPASDLVQCASPDEAAARLEALYDEAHAQTRARFERYLAGEAMDAGADGQESGAVYPYLCAVVPAEAAPQTSKLALGQVASVSVHGATVTQPALFANYFREQLARVIDRFSAKVFVGKSFTPIPLTFALEKATASLTAEKRNRLQYHFHTPNLVSTNDDIVDGQFILKRHGAMPLSLFTAERIDYSLHRIQHYTATKPEHFQNYILLELYQFY